MSKKADFLKLKKKILIYAAYATLGITTLTGCQNSESNLTYGTISYNETINYEDFKNYVLVETTINNEKEYLIAKKVEIDKEYKYIDIVTGNIIENYNVYILCDNIEYYLKKYDRVKEEYNMEDIEIITFELLSDEDINKFLTQDKKRTLELN